MWTTWQVISMLAMAVLATTLGWLALDFSVLRSLWRESKRREEELKRILREFERSR